jgi:putative peptide zinc metalloprotease protein
MVIGLMDGKRTVQELWDIAMRRLGDEAPTQDEMIHLLSQLHAADVLQCDVSPDALELLRRHERQQRRARLAQLTSVLSWRIPLIDPERFLNRTVALVRPFMGWVGALLWLVVVGTGVVLAATHWGDLTNNIIDRVLAPQSLLMLYLAFPIVKALHEFGHAYTVKAFGGEVHDMGLMLLVLTPIPYVDASAASAFRSKWQRAVVGAAGMLVELVIATVALVVWLSVQHGTVRTLAYNVIFIAGLSTIIFNANPLLRFDGYYILADLLEIPNLRTRATAYLGYLTERYLFGRRDAEPAPATPGERAWFVVYAVTSFVYRLMVALGIVLFIAGKFFFVGVLLAISAALAWLVVPAAKAIGTVFWSPRLRRVRPRAIAVTVALVALVVGLVGFVPVPFRSRAEGVVWVPDEAIVRAETEGFVDRVVASPGARVRRGDVLVLLGDPELATRVRLLEARVRELEARYTAERVADRVKAEIVREELAYGLSTLARARERQAALVVRARADGEFVIPFAEDLPGRWVRQGEALAHVVERSQVTVRAVVTQAEIELVRHRTGEVKVRLAERLDDTVVATVAREVPGASDRLPSPALGAAGGGAIPVDPTDTQGARALDRVFQLDLEVPSPGHVVNVGGRVYVRFDHGHAPLAVQWYRTIRQLLLARFNV